MKKTEGGRRRRRNQLHHSRKLINNGTHQRRSPRNVGGSGIAVVAAAVQGAGVGLPRQWYGASRALVSDSHPGVSDSHFGVSGSPPSALSKSRLCFSYSVTPGCNVLGGSGSFVVCISININEWTSIDGWTWTNRCIGDIKSCNKQ
nr:hypothetical protein Iba_chr02eCG11820 [Ipomoea batatas]